MRIACHWTGEFRWLCMQLKGRILENQSLRSFNSQKVTSRCKSLSNTHLPYPPYSNYYTHIINRSLHALKPTLLTYLRQRRRHYVFISTPLSLLLACINPHQDDYTTLLRRQIITRQPTHPLGSFTSPTTRRDQHGRNFAAWSEVHE